MEADRTRQWSVEKRNDHRKWLVMAIKDNPNNLAARVALSNLHRANGDTFAAFSVLESMAGRDSSVDHVLVMLERDLGRIPEAQRRAGGLIRTNLGVLADAPELLDLRIRTASLLVFVDRVEEAEKLLKQGENYLISETDEELFRRAVSESYVLMANKTAETDTSPRGLLKRLNYLLSAIEFDPSGPTVTDAVLEACSEASSSGNDQALVLKEAIVRGISPEAAILCWALWRCLKAILTKRWTILRSPSRNPRMCRVR